MKQSNNTTQYVTGQTAEILPDLPTPPAKATRKPKPPAITERARLWNNVTRHQVALEKAMAAWRTWQLSDPHHDARPPESTRRA